MRDMGSDRPFGVSRSRLAPGEAAQQLRIARHATFDLSFRLEARDQVSRVHLSKLPLRARRRGTRGQLTLSAVQVSSPWRTRTSCTLPAGPTAVMWARSSWMPGL